MRNRSKVARLGRLSNHRRAMLRNLARALILEGRIKTTDVKAKALRSFIEPMVTRARADSVHNRREVARKLPDKTAVKRLFESIAPRYTERQGGYVRITRISGVRKGDAARISQVEWV